jgi:adenylate cyclase
VLFADISGSTTLYAERGDAAAFRLASVCLTAVERAIGAGGGRVVKRLGDGMLALFEQSNAALRTALAARASLADPDHTAQRTGLRVRFGIGCGEVVLADDDVFGDVVNVAARLLGLARPDEILLAGTAYETLEAELRDRVHLIDQLVLRNRPAPVPVYKFVDDELDATAGVETRARGDSAVLEIAFAATVFVLGPERPRLSIGRHSAHDICVDHEAVSRLHAEIMLRGGKFILADRSMNGTYVHIENGPVLRLVREELSLSGTGRIVPGVDTGTPIRFRLTRP